MLQTNDQVLQKLLLERSRLVDLIKNLETFMCTKDFTCLPYEHTRLLSEQHSIMQRYNEVLLKRIMLLREDAERCEENYCCKKECSRKEE